MEGHIVHSIYHFKYNMKLYIIDKFLLFSLVFYLVTHILHYIEFTISLYLPDTRL